VLPSYMHPVKVTDFGRVQPGLLCAIRRWCCGLGGVCAGGEYAQVAAQTPWRVDIGATPWISIVCAFPFLRRGEYAQVNGTDLRRGRFP